MIPDWISLSIAAIGILAGIFVSWYFYREQQKTDFNRLERNLGGEFKKVAKTIGKIEKSIEISQKIDLAQDLTSIRATIEDLRDEMRHLSERILEDVRHKQDGVLSEMQTEFRHHIEGSKIEIRQALQKEIADIVAPELHESALKRLSVLYVYALRSVGDYQRQSIEVSLKTSLEDLEHSLQSEVRKVAEQVEELGRQFDEVTISLPPPNEGA